MTEIQDFNTSPLRNNEFLGFLTKIREAASYISVEADQPFIEAFYNAYNAYDKVLQVDMTNSFTVEVGEADHRINTAWSGLRKQTRAMSTFPNEEKKKIANESLHIIDKYGSISSMGHNEKEGAVQNALQDFELLGIENQQKISIDIWIDELSSSKNALVSALMKQAAEEEKRVKGSTKAKREEVDTCYKSLVKRVNSAANVNGVEPYKTFIGYANVFINDARTVITARKTRSKNASNDESAPKELV